MIYKIIEKLVEKKIHICFSCQFNKGGEFYVVNVNDMYGKEHTFSGYQLSEVENNLKVMWGHALSEPKRTLAPLPPLPNMVQ